MQFRTLNISPEKVSLYLVFFFFIALTFFSRKIPFFWDEVFYSLSAHHIYDSGFASIIPPDKIDSRNCLTYGAYLAICWKLFGKSLLVSHFCMLPILLGIVWEYYRLAEKFIHQRFLPFAFFLLIFEPTLVTQSILMGHDLFFIFFFLLCINSLLENRRIIYTIGLCILVIGNVRGELAGITLIVTDIIFLCIMSRKISLRFSFPYLSVFSLFLLWIFFHHSVKGWYYLVPGKTLFSETFSIAMVFKRIILEIWQIIDFGRILLWTFISIMTFYLWRKNKLSYEIKRLLMLIAVPLIIFTCIIAVLQAIPICHRYFLLIFLLSNILVCSLLENIFFKKIITRLILLIFCLGLSTGNFWLYGGGFSNGWDSSLKVLPYFKLKSDMVTYVKEEKINSGDVGTKFPLYHDEKYTSLANESFHYTDMNNDSLEQYKYILLSNVSNQFTVDEKKKLNSNWNLIKEFSRGQVYLRLFKNPNTE